MTKLITFSPLTCAPFIKNITLQPSRKLHVCLIGKACPHSTPCFLVSQEWLFFLSNRYLQTKSKCFWWGCRACLNRNSQAWEQHWKKGGSCVPLKELKLPNCEEQQSLWIWHCLDPARAVQCGPRRSGAGPAQDLYGAIRAWLQLHLWRSLVSGNVIVYQFPKTNKASYCDRSVCYENQRFHSHDGKTLKYATFENSSPSKIFKVNDGVAMVVARLQSCCICNL